MNQQNVFLNFVPQDRQIADQIQLQLAVEGIDCYFPPAVTNVDEHYEVVNQIKERILNKSALMVILSKAALEDAWFVCNVQYACELAERRTVLVILQIEDLPKDNPIALYYAQAVLIRANKQTSLPLKRLVTATKRVLRCKDVPKTFYPRRLPKKAINLAFVIVAIGAVALGVSSYFLPWLTDLIQPGSPPISTPVVFENPFSGESIDQGIIVDRRAVPGNPPGGDPQAEAPFTFTPAVIHKRFSFDDPAMENLDVLNIGSQYGNRSISSKDQTILRQIQGNLQISIAPTDPSGGKYLGFDFPHLMETHQLSYIGVRFYVENYQGWSDANRPNWIGFQISTTDQEKRLCLINVGAQQILSGEGMDIQESGAGWHALELVPNKDFSSGTLYLDGQELDRLSLDEGMNRYFSLNYFLSAEFSTDWINFYIDELVFGGGWALTAVESPEELAYLLTPDEIYYQETFTTPPVFPVQVNGEGVAIRDGKLQFTIPQDTADQGMDVKIPARPIDEMNYFSMKYRIVDYALDPWSEWGSITIRLVNQTLRQDQGYESIGAFASRYGAEYILQVGKNAHFGWDGSFENFQPGSWHVMELAIQPSTTMDNQYIMQYWHDGVLVGEQEIIPVDYFLGDYPFEILFSANGGWNRQTSFRVDFDEIRVGQIDFPGLEAGD